ncbi:MAG: carbon storage regulator [Patescibacteria group bacterium]
MLVLSRKKNEEIVISDNIKIVVLEIMNGTTVRLGIEAPKEIPIYRKELLDSILQKDGKQ